MGRLALQLPTNEPNFTIERFENGYYRISGISLQTIQINLNEMMQTASAAPSVTGTALRQPTVTRQRRTAHAATLAPARKPHTLSAAGRKRIAAAQKARWAKKREAGAIAGETAPVPTAQKRQRTKQQPKTMTAAG
jgi:hypothetical protein